MGWPKPSAQFDKAAAEKFSFMKDVKSIIRLGLDQSKGGGKKAKKGAPVEAKTLENAVVFVAIEYPEFKKKCLEILQTFEFDADNKIQGDYLKAIKEAFPDKKQNNLAMSFVRQQLGIAELEGKQFALRLDPAFDEAALIEANKPFLFENMPTIKTIRILLNTCEEAATVEGSE